VTLLFQHQSASISPIFHQHQVNDFQCFFLVKSTSWASLETNSFTLLILSHSHHFHIVDIRSSWSVGNYSRRSQPWYSVSMPPNTIHALPTHYNVDSVSITIDVNSFGSIRLLHSFERSIGGTLLFSISRERLEFVEWCGEVGGVRVPIALGSLVWRLLGVGGELNEFEHFRGDWTLFTVTMCPLNVLCFIKLVCMGLLSLILQQQAWLLLQCRPFRLSWKLTSNRVYGNHCATLLSSNFLFHKYQPTNHHSATNCVAVVSLPFSSLLTLGWCWLWERVTAPSFQ
jgi:hypothetical protein